MNLLFIILIFTLVGCASARRQQRFLDSTIVTRDSIAAVRIDSVTGDTIRYRRRDISISHTPTWENRHGLLFIIAVTVITVVTIIIKLK